MSQLLLRRLNSRNIPSSVTTSVLAEQRRGRNSIVFQMLSRDNYAMAHKTERLRAPRKNLSSRRGDDLTPSTYCKELYDDKLTAGNVVGSSSVRAITQTTENVGTGLFWHPWTSCYGMNSRHHYQGSSLRCIIIVLCTKQWISHHRETYYDGVTAGSHQTSYRLQKIDLVSVLTGHDAIKWNQLNERYRIHNPLTCDMSILLSQEGYGMIEPEILWR